MTMLNSPTGADGERYCIPCKKESREHEVKKRHPTELDYGFSHLLPGEYAFAYIFYCTGCKAESQIMIEGDSGM